MNGPLAQPFGSKEAKMKQIINIVAVGVCFGVLISCVEHRPIRNGLRDESIYLEKSVLTRPNPKLSSVKDDGWLMRMTAIKSSSPNIMGEYVFPGHYAETRYVKVKFQEDAMQLVDGRRLQFDDPQDPNDNLATTSDLVVYEFKGVNVDVKMQETLDGERTNLLQENFEEPWQKRQKFKIDFEETTYDPIGLIWWGWVDWLHDCVDMTSMHFVPGSFEQDNEDQYMSWVVEVNYRLRSITGYGGCWSMVQSVQEVGTGSVQYRISMYRPGPSNFETQIIPEKDVVNKKYGAFQVLNAFRDDTTGLLSANSYLVRWNPKRTKPVTYYFHQGFPEKFMPLFENIASETNRVMEEAGSTLRFEFKPKPKNIHYGDIRHSFVVWHQDIDTTLGLLGYGPPVYHPLTGEILSANLNMYNVGLDRYRYLIQDYLEEFGGLSKPEDGPWEEIECTVGDTVAPATHSGRLNTALFRAMRRVMDLPESPTNPLDPEADFIPTPERTREEFLADYRRLLPELRFAEPRYNLYTGMVGTGVGPSPEYKERVKVDLEFQEAMNAILLGENPYGPVGLYGREGIEAQNEFAENFRYWKKNHQELERDRKLILSRQFIDTFDEGNAMNAIKASARKCVADGDTGRWESDTEYTERLIEDIVAHVAIHEFGHNLSLRHNFYGSVDAKHMGPNKLSSSIMDYVWAIHEANTSRNYGAYDEAALKWIYGTDTVREDMMDQDYLYCTDYHVYRSPFCSWHDLGVTPAQILLNAIETYDWLYEIRNRRAYRTFWDTSGYIYSVFEDIFEMHRMWYTAIFDWGGGGIQETLKRVDQVEGNTVLTPQEYDAHAMDIYNDVIAANGLIMAFYDAVINQAATFRNYQTEFDPYYGDIIRIGIINDKLFTTYAFMDLQDVYNYDPNVYTYVSMFDLPFGSKNNALSQRVLDNMLGANYDTFPWFKYLALNLFAYNTNSNLMYNLELKERIAILRYDNMMEFESVFGPDALLEATMPDNPAQLFWHNGEEYVYTYLADRQWHLVASKSRSPVSYQYMKDYNEALNAEASTSLDTYGLKILLAYYEYYNNFQGF